MNSAQLTVYLSKNKHFAGCAKFCCEYCRVFMCVCRGGSYLLQFVNDHGECFEDGGGRTSQGYDSLWTVPL